MRTAPTRGIDTLRARDLHFPRSRAPTRFRWRGRRRARRARVSSIECTIVKALVKAAAGPGFALQDVPRPTIRDDEVLIRVRRAGVCGTDVHIYDWDDWAQGRCKPPFVVGHEFAGDVVQVGQLVDRRAGGRPRDRRGPHRRRPLPALPHRQRARLPAHAASSASTATAASPSTSRCRRRTSGTSTTTISFDIGGIHDPMGNAFHTALTAEIPGATVLDHRLRADRHLRGRHLQGGGRVAHHRVAT